MPVPTFMAHVNKRIFNPREIRRGSRPVLTHVGRSTGKVYHTPLDAHAVDGGYIFILMYGPDSDWVRNVVAAGRATLRVDGEEIVLDTPRRLVTSEAVKELPEDVKLPAGYLRVDDYLRMSLRSAHSTARTPQAEALINP